MNHTFKIEKNIPFTRKDKLIWPFATMHVGESFKVPRKLMKKVDAVKWYYMTKNDAVFKRRGNRVWRTK